MKGIALSDYASEKGLVSNPDFFGLLCLSHIPPLVCRRKVKRAGNAVEVDTNLFRRVSAGATLS